ncbi:unnamed protein product, partial [Closterium sp. NIES-54]
CGPLSAPGAASLGPYRDPLNALSPPTTCAAEPPSSTAAKQPSHPTAAPPEQPSSRVPQPLSSPSRLSRPSRPASEPPAPPEPPEPPEPPSCPTAAQPLHLLACPGPTYSAVGCKFPLHDILPSVCTSMRVRMHLGVNGMFVWFFAFAIFA